MFRLTWSACQKPDGNQPINKVVDLGTVAHYFIGDYYYNDSGGTQFFNNINYVPTVYGPGGNNTQQRNLDRFIGVYGRAGMSAYQAFWAAKDAGKLKVYAMPDDHDGGWNNNDHSLAVFKDTYNVAGGTLAGMLDAAVAKTDVLAQWRLGQTCLGIIQAAYFDNVWGPPNGNIPSAMVGTATAADYATKYFYTDYNLSGSNGGALSHRVIVPDCISYKDPAANVDNSSKTMLGAVQLQWLKDSIASAVAASANHVLIFWTKDLLNKDNGDGGAGYRTEVDGLLSWIQTNNYPVIHCTGDRHCPHASIARMSNGDLYDAVVACACPFGQGCGSLTQYAENDWSWAYNDACVFGMVEVDEIKRTTTVMILDAFSTETMWAATIPFGSRLPTQVVKKEAKDFRASPAPLRAAPSVPGTGVAYVNTSPTPVNMVISGGTITSIEISRDQSTWDLTGLTQGTFVLAPGDAIRWNGSVAPTKFISYPLS